MTLTDYWAVVVETRTGAVVDELPVSDFSWNDSLDLARSGSMTVTVPYAGRSQTDERSLRVKARGLASGPWFLSLALIRRGRPLWAGPLISYSAGDDSVDFVCASIFKLLERRLVIAAGYELTPALPGADIRYPLNQASVAWSLLNLAVTGTTRALPVTLPSMTLVGDFQRSYAAADLASVTERLTALTQEDGGPDLRVRPTLDVTQSQLSWAFEIGTPLGVTPAPWTWDYPSTVIDLTEDMDASAMTFTGYVPGQSGSTSGQNSARPIGIYRDPTFTDQGWPSLEATDRGNSSTTEKVLLGRQAKSLVEASMTPTLGWKITVDPEQWPVIGDWSFGDNAQIAVYGHPWIPDGVYIRRLLGVTHKPGTAELEITDPLPQPGLRTLLRSTAPDGGDPSMAMTIADAIIAGPTSSRPNPDLGRVYFDSDLDIPIFGNGTAWVDATGGLITEAPRGMTATVQSDNSIVLSWSAVAGATTYKLYEDQSLSGVAGATALTGTTTTRNPATQRTYHYWVTAMVNGQETDPSNKATAVLPYASTPGGGTAGGGTPAQILKIDGVGGGTGGYWNEGIGFHSADAEGANHVDISMSDIAGGYTRAFYFTPAQGGAAVQFAVYCDGATTSANTHYPRSELRELQSSGSNASWDASSGTHVLSGISRVIHGTTTKDEVVIAQMHNSSDDTIQLRVQGSDITLNINGTYTGTPLLSGYTKGTDITWEIRLVNGLTTVTINGVQKYSATPGFGGGNYFKAGCYAQAASGYTSGVSASDYFAVELRNLLVLHS